jgi:hypothetical protein
LKFATRPHLRQSGERGISVIPAKAGIHFAVASGAKRKIKLDPGLRRDDEVMAR